MDYGNLLSDDAWSGAGSSNLSDVQELIKALEAQEGVTDIANLTSIGALQPQSLEGKKLPLYVEIHNSKLCEFMGSRNVKSSVIMSEALNKENVQRLFREEVQLSSWKRKAA